MKKRICITVAVGLAVTAQTYAAEVSTWHNLYFGMSQAEVESAMGGRANASSSEGPARPEDPYEVKLVSTGFLEENRKGLSSRDDFAHLAFDVSFWFSKATGRLERVSLLSSDPFKNLDKKHQLSKSLSAIQDVELELSDFGSNPTSDGPCDAKAALKAIGDSLCDKVYHPGVTGLPFGQTITLSWICTAGRVLWIKVTFEPPQVVRKYDRFQDQTTFTVESGDLPGVATLDKRIRSASLSLTSSCSGNVQACAGEGILLRFSFFNRETMYLAGGNIAMLLDGHRQQLPPSEYGGPPFPVTDIPGVSVLEAVGVQLPAGALSRMAESRLIEVQIGDLEFALAADFFRAMSSVIKPGN